MQTAVLLDNNANVIYQFGGSFRANRGRVQRVCERIPQINFTTHNIMMSILVIIMGMHDVYMCPRILHYTLQIKHGVVCLAYIIMDVYS